MSYLLVRKFTPEMVDKLVAFLEGKKDPAKELKSLKVIWARNDQKYVSQLPESVRVPFHTEHMLNEEDFNLEKEQLTIEGETYSFNTFVIMSVVPCEGYETPEDVSYGPAVKVYPQKVQPTLKVVEDDDLDDNFFDDDEGFAYEDDLDLPF